METSGDEFSKRQIQTIIKVWEKYSIHTSYKLLLELNMFGSGEERKRATSHQNQFLIIYQKIKQKNLFFINNNKIEFLKAYKILTNAI